MSDTLEFSQLYKQEWKKYLDRILFDIDQTISIPEFVDSLHPNSWITYRKEYYPKRNKCKWVNRTHKHLVLHGFKIRRIKTMYELQQLTHKEFITYLAKYGEVPQWYGILISNIFFRGFSVSWFPYLSKEPDLKIIVDDLLITPAIS